jgi:putative Mg2+ transporter-C (MgtC) family protein
MNEWIAFGHLIAALVAGALFGIERTYRGRPAGFRTYAVVCVASAILMVAMSLPQDWVVAGAVKLSMSDPTRVMQGIMTGIGFLGAGVIVKEGFSVRGLTTAASIWATAAIGIVIGSGFLIFGLLATLLTVGLLAALRPLEDRLPMQHHLHLQIGYARNDVLPEPGLRELLGRHSMRLTELSYELDPETESFTYRMMVWTHSQDSVRALVAALNATSGVRFFRISPMKKD